jgi:hypothetical protein
MTHQGYLGQIGHQSLAQTEPSCQFLLETWRAHQHCHWLTVQLDFQWLFDNHAAIHGTPLMICQAQDAPGHDAAYPRLIWTI